MSVNGKKPFDKRTASRSLFALLLLVVGFWLTLWFMGREFVSDSGFGIWTGARTKDTSQWIADPYTLSHLLHGILFYWLLLPTQRWLTVQSRFIIASLIEAGWEILENTPSVIDRYRAATASRDYYGDSILNSTFDLLMAMLGFWLASRYNWKWMLLVVVAIELVLALLIRDNLTLNILMLLYPLDGIKEWQLGT
jgi:uncharacterized protein DUF2585